MCSCQQDIIKKLKEENEELKNKLNELYKHCDNYCENKMSARIEELEKDNRQLAATSAEIVSGVVHETNKNLKKLLLHQ
jgi:hypothetical protein